MGGGGGAVKMIIDLGPLHTSVDACGEDGLTSRSLSGGIRGLGIVGADAGWGV